MSDEIRQEERRRIAGQVRHHVQVFDVALPNEVKIVLEGMARAIETDVWPTDVAREKLRARTRE